MRGASLNASLNGLSDRLPGYVLMLDALDELSLRWRRHKAAAAEIAAEEARREQRETDEALNAALLAAQARQREREESVLKAKHAAATILSEKEASFLGVLEASPLKMDLGQKRVWKKAIANTLSEADEWAEWMRNEIEVRATKCLRVPLRASECLCVPPSAN